MAKKKAPKVKKRLKLNNGSPAASSGGGQDSNPEDVKNGAALAGSGIVAVNQLFTPMIKNESTETVVDRAAKTSAVGMQIGSQFGLEGAIIGLGAGALVGSISGAIANNQRKAEERKRASRLTLEANNTLAELKRETTDVFSTDESIYNNARIDGDSIIGLPGVGRTKFMAQGGKVKGAGGPKDDAIDTSLEEGSVVVPAENAEVAAKLRELVFGESGNTKMKGGGKVLVSLSNGEHVFTPKEKDAIDLAVTAKGGDPKSMWDKLIPNPSDGNELADGSKDVDGGDDVASLLKAIEKAEIEASKKEKANLELEKNELAKKRNKIREEGLNAVQGKTTREIGAKKEINLAIQKAKSLIKQGRLAEAKQQINKIPQLQKRVEQEHNPDNYEYTHDNILGFNTGVSAKFNEEKAKKNSSVETAPKKALAVNPNSPLDPNKAKSVAASIATPTTTTATQAAVNNATKKKVAPAAKAKVETAPAPTGPPSSLPRQDGGISDFSETPADVARNISASDLKLAEVPKTVGSGTELNKEMFKAEDEKKGFMSDVNATDILSMGQVLAGLMTANKERPLDKPNPIFVHRVAASIGAAEKAKDEAEYGFGYKENKAIDSSIEENRRQTMRDVVQTSSGSGPTMGILRTISQDKNQAILDKAVQNENVKRGKQQNAAQLSAEADQMSARLDSRGREIFADDKEAYYAESQAAGNLMMAGLTNFFNNQDQKKIEKERAKREKKPTTNLLGQPI